ncbi:hypothetical protein GALMADRAFT_243654 [Galerina marginata CBS 339.88]|uniref:BTB domain-containing protein n=1 Tax=Galerina marginata (strain CBS 339.88) TaxID=685588 RepID=A0A067T8N8_GALM3|nr:hypothetical protein GALMADRAFT_243654 [Galerina marginata CBS 339.88]
MALIDLTSSFPNGKRKRTSPQADSDGKDQAVIVKSPRFWFEDGNIIFQAQNTQFRVYKGIMTRNSKFFREKLALPRPLGEDLVEGCSVVYLDDSEKDWVRIFAILYDSDVSYKSMTVLLPLPLLSSMLRLGKKYEIQKVYDAALERIKLEFPESLAQWDETFPPGTGGLSRIGGHAVDLLDILLDLGVRKLLPLAYFRCAWLSVETIFRPMAREDGEAIRLPIGAIETVLSGKERLRHAVLEHRFGWVKTYTPGFHRPGCVTPLFCERSALCTMRDSANFSAACAFLSYDVFLAQSFCQNCFAQVKAASEAGRQKIWDELPSYFGLPAWKDLR